MINKLSGKLLTKSFDIVETFLAAIIIIGVILSAFFIFKHIHIITVAPDRVELFDYEVFKRFISFVLILIIGVELGQMLIMHTPGKIIEILLLAIARKLLIYSDMAYEFVLGVIAIAGLFAIRKYLFLEHFNPLTSCFLGANTPLCDVNSILGTHLPKSTNPKTIGGLVHSLARKHNREIRKDDIYYIAEAEFKIIEIEDGKVLKLEAKKSDKK